MAWDTVANVVSDAAIELGLVPTAIANPYAATDPNILQLNALLKTLGQRLLRARQWSHLVTRYTFNTVDGTASYALPTPFGRIIDQTAWNTTNQRPMAGPATAQAWEGLKATSTTGVDDVFRIFGDLFYIHPTPSSIEAIAYAYASRYWVDTGGGTTPDAEAPTTKDDSLFFDRQLLVSGLKLAFLRTKGFDTTTAQGEYDAAWAYAASADGAAPVLSIGGGGSFHYLDCSNITGLVGT